MWLWANCASPLQTPHALLWKKKSLTCEIWLPTLTFWHPWKQNSSTNNLSLPRREKGHIDWYRLSSVIWPTWHQWQRKTDKADKHRADRKQPWKLMNVFSRSVYIRCRTSLPPEQVPHHQHLLPEQRTKTKAKSALVNKLKTLRIYSP